MPKTRFLPGPSLVNFQASEVMLDHLEERRWDEAMDMLRQGADPSISNGAHTALELAIENDAPRAMIEALLAHGADPNGAALASFGGSRGILINALQAGHSEAVRSLLAHGASPHQTTENGVPAVHVAARQWGDSGLAVMLVKSGASADLPEDAQQASKLAIHAIKIRRQLAAAIDDAAKGHEPLSTEISS